jgi:hypothetical protein
VLAARIFTTIAALIITFCRHTQSADIWRWCFTQQSVFMQK